MCMRRFVSLSLAVTGLLVAAPALAVTKQDDVTATVHKKGQQGSQLIYKGTVKSKAFGKGTVVEKVYGSTLKGSFVITYKKGKIKGTSTAKLGSVSGPKIKVTGTYKITVTARKVAIASTSARIVITNIARMLVISSVARAITCPVCAVSRR